MRAEDQQTFPPRLTSELLQFKHAEIIEIRPFLGQGIPDTERRKQFGLFS